MPAFALRQVLAPEAGGPPCNVVCAACPPVTCRSLSCSGQASTGTTGTQWAWSFFVLALGWLLGSIPVFYILRRCEEQAHQTPQSAPRPSLAPRAPEGFGGTIVAVTPTSRAAPRQ